MNHIHFLIKKEKKERRKNPYTQGEDEEIDLQDLDDAYEQDLDKEDTQSDAKAENAQQNLEQDLAPVPAA